MALVRINTCDGNLISVMPITIYPEPHVSVTITPYDGKPVYMILSAEEVAKLQYALTDALTNS